VGSVVLPTPYKHMSEMKVPIKIIMLCQESPYFYGGSMDIRYVRVAHATDTDELSKTSYKLCKCFCPTPRLQPFRFCGAAIPFTYKSCITSVGRR